MLDHLLDDGVMETFRDFVSCITAERDRRNVRGRGRPEIAIGEEQLRFLIEQGFRIQDIANMFGCCRRTVERKMETYNITLHYSTITDSELDVMVRDITTLYPNCCVTQPINYK